MLRTELPTEDIFLGRWRQYDMAVLCRDGEVVDLYAEAEQAGALRPGAICRAIVTRLVRGQGGVFVALPDGQSGFLRGVSGLRSGEAVLVQLSGAPQDAKAWPCSIRPILRGQSVLVTLGAPGVNISRSVRDAEERQRLEALAQVREAPGYGIIIRSAAPRLSDAVIRAELDELTGIADRMIQDVEGEPDLLIDASSPAEWALTEWGASAASWVDDPREWRDSGVIEQLDNISSAEISLVDGRIWVEATRAILAVDVDTGSDTSPAAGVKANLATARALPRLLHLRGQGGQVVIDFAPMQKRDRGTIEQALRSAAKREGDGITCVGWTTLGLYELTARRGSRPLV